MRILITGSRHHDFNSAHIIEAAIANYLAIYGIPLRSQTQFNRPTIVHGAAKGADSIAHNMAQRYGWASEAHPADWQTYGAAAGPIRNKRMVDLGADVCIGFPYGQEHEGNSKGTWNCLRYAEHADIPTLFVYQQRFFPLNTQGARVLVRNGVPLSCDELFG